MGVLVPDQAHCISNRAESGHLLLRVFAIGVRWGAHALDRRRVAVFCVIPTV